MVPLCIPIITSVESHKQAVLTLGLVLVFVTARC